MTARATNGLLRSTGSKAAAERTLAEAARRHALRVAKVQTAVGRDLGANAQVAPGAPKPTARLLGVASVVRVAGARVASGIVPRRRRGGRRKGED